MYDELETLAQQFKGSGILNGRAIQGVWVGTETITINLRDIGVVVNNLTGAEAPTPVFKIHYGPRGIHIVPDYLSKKGAKAKKMKYTMEKLFAFMDSGRAVSVTRIDGQTYTGRCWAYGPAENEEEYGVCEPSIDVGPGILLYASEIAHIEFAD